MKGKDLVSSLLAFELSGIEIWQHSVHWGMEISGWLASPILQTQDINLVECFFEQHLSVQLGWVGQLLIYKTEWAL